mgnify:CR=1 FL=1
MRLMSDGSVPVDFVLALSAQLFRDAEFDFTADEQRAQRSSKRHGGLGRR